MELKKEGNFSEWYSKVLFEAGIVDVRYPIKGMPVYMPWGFRAMDYMFGILEHMLDEAGHDKVLFPVAIPQTIFSRESEHIRGFEGEVLWVTHGGKNMLEEQLVLRPTSETSMYPIFALWIRSHADLPLKVYQTTAIYRHETKATRPLIRGREVYWNEGHSAHATRDDAVHHVESIIDIYRRFYEQLCLPFKLIKRPEHDKFAGADYTYAFDTVMPDGKTLQIGTVHNLGQNFAKAYDVMFCDEDGENKHVHQSSYGISMRALAAVLSVHGDDKGLVLPFDISPVQIVFIPIYSKGNKNEVDEYLREAYGRANKKYRCRYDDGDKRPGDKFYYWELKGVPVRVEAGMRDIEKKKLTIVDRLGNKLQVDYDAFDDAILSVIKSYSAHLRDAARKFFDDHLSDAGSFDELADIMNSKRGFITAGWCGDMECVEKLKSLAVDVLGYEGGEMKDRKCIVCGKEGKQVVLGKPY